MISQRQIERMIETEDFRQLAERILLNGRSQSASARQLLCRSEIAGAVGLGLALQRLAELSYALQPIEFQAARKLVLVQRRDGTFGYGPELASDLRLAATAVAIRGLVAWTNRITAAGQTVHYSYQTAIERGLGTIADMSRSRRPRDSESLAWAIVLWQLGDLPELRKLISLTRIRAIVKDSAVAEFGDDLSRLALLVAA